MSLYGSFLSDEQFLCSICLDMFTNPSSTPCGHSFCMACISKYWDGSKTCQCPLCKKTFQKRPDLQINRTLREITDQFRTMRGSGGQAKDKKCGRGVGGEGVLPENLFDELKKKLPRTSKMPVRVPGEAQASSESGGVPIPTSISRITAPLASSVPDGSPIHSLKDNSRLPLPPPSFSPPPGGRRRFTVSGAGSSKSLPICDIHRRGIVIYCRTDQACICPDCETENHQHHDTVTIKDEWMEKKAQLGEAEQAIQDMIRERIKKMEEIRSSFVELELAVERETAGSVSLFSALMSAVERSQVDLMEMMAMTHKAAEHQADAMIRQLELDVKELRRRESALEELAKSDDHMHCVKTFPNICSPPPIKDWTGVMVNSDLGTGTIYISLAAQVERFREELKNIAETGFPAPAVEPTPVRTQPRMKRVQDYAVDVRLDSNTAHPRLIISEDMKSVWCGERHQLLPDNVERFDRVVCVLGKQMISSGRHYWEVEVGGKTDWDLGVAKQSINRKGKIDINPSNGYWFLSLRDKNKYAFRSDPSTDVQLDLRPHKIGIFVDFENGQVSFYNVDAKLHIYTFNNPFGECIYPFFSPCTNKSGKNDGPLILTAVNMSD
ncbi:E3 ubiquitin-protein ligase TRIM68 [Brachionichthys hirsutus]|uniref:E3 ubiquitin-protein ligase TRIM68 n=1 Tax=Brachionichthys hirsutus TaxID=412623 RepID=UPI00360469B1